MIVHEPPPVMCTSVPVTVQAPVAPNETGRLDVLDRRDVEVGITERLGRQGGERDRLVGLGDREGPGQRDSRGDGRGASGDAVMEHVPSPVMWTVAGEVAGLTVHGPLALSATGRPAVLVGEMVKSGSRTVASLIGAKVMSWLPVFTGGTRVVGAEVVVERRGRPR